MAGKGRITFNELARPIHADPKRAARSDAAYDDALAEHVSYSLNELRESLGLTQAQLAEALGVTQPAVSQALDHASTLAAIRRLVEGMGCELKLIAEHDGKQFVLS